MTKKDSLFRGTVILAVAAIVARLLGLAQRVPLNDILGDVGSAPYGNANNLYLMLLPIATAGIPSALSKLVAEKSAVGKLDEAEQIFQASLRFAIIAGVAITVPIMALSPFLAKWAKIEEATLSILAIAPALLIFPVIAMLRGYFQGRQLMMAGGLSQIWEQIFRVMTSVLLAYVLTSAGYSVAWVSAGASFGGALGALAALCVMLYYLRKLRQTDRASSGSFVSSANSKVNTRAMMKNLLKLSVPISLYSSTVSLINWLDSMLAVPLLTLNYGGNDILAKVELGVLIMKAQSLSGIAVMFAVALSQCLVPIISEAYARGDLVELRRKGFQAIFMALVSGIGVISIIVTGAEPINALIFEQPTGTGIIITLTIVTIFQILMMTSGAILMGMGKMRLLIYNVAVCIGVKFLFTLLLTPTLNMYGMILGTGLCYLASATMNLIYLRHTIGLVFLGKRWSGMLATVLILVGTGFGLSRLNTHVQLFNTTTTLSFKLNAMVQCLVVCLVIGGIYVPLLFISRVMNKQDLTSLPFPIRSGLWFNRLSNSRKK